MTNRSFRTTVVGLLGIIAVCLGARVYVAARSKPVVAPPGDNELWDDNITDSDWERMKREALAAPPLRWTTSKTDPLYQSGEFIDWTISTGYVVPEVLPAVEAWLDGDENSLDAVITNEPTGAQYRITGSRGPHGASCDVKFVGNIGWE